jgi:hypothetical protein
MKKKFCFLILLAAFLTLPLLSCSSSAQSVPPALEAESTASVDSTVAGSETAQSQTLPAADSKGAAASSLASSAAVKSETSQNHTYAKMNPNKIDFGSDVDEFFNAYFSTDIALDKLQPVLFSAVSAEENSGVSFFADAEPVNSTFEWQAVYGLINDFEFGRDGVKQVNGNIIVLSNVMKGFFTDELGMAAIPDLPVSLSQLISFDKISGKYTLISADGGGSVFVLRDIVLSKPAAANDPTKNAEVWIDIQDNSGKTVKTVVTELIHSDLSSYHYAVMNVYTAK